MKRSPHQLSPPQWSFFLSKPWRDHSGGDSWRGGLFMKQLKMSETRILVRLLRRYFPRNWEFGSALSKLRNFGGGSCKPPPRPLRRPLIFRMWFCRCKKQFLFSGTAGNLHMNTRCHAWEYSCARPILYNSQVIKLYKVIHNIRIHTRISVIVTGKFIWSFCVNQ
jgi:hypothetical protein